MLTLCSGVATGHQGFYYKSRADPLCRDSDSLTHTPRRARGANNQVMLFDEPAWAGGSVARRRSGDGLGATGMRRDAVAAAAAWRARGDDYAVVLLLSWGSNVEVFPDDSARRQDILTSTRN